MFHQRWILQFALIGLPLAALAADDKPKDADSPGKAKRQWIELSKAHIQECSVTVGKPARPLEVRAEPVLHHIQSVRHIAVGSAFLWMEPSGRPGAVVDIFFHRSGKMANQFQMQTEWHSLTTDPMTVKWQGANYISTTVPGLNWKEISDAGSPPDTKLKQERELRRLSRRFTSHLVNKTNDRYELRLLTTPVLDYAPKADFADSNFLVGALFAFCQENDPELFLMIEARKTDNGPRWMYSPVEFSNLNLYLRLDEQEVWNATPPRFSSSGPHSAYIVKDAVTLEDAIESEAAK